MCLQLRSAIGSLESLNRSPSSQRGKWTFNLRYPSIHEQSARTDRGQASCPSLQPQGCMSPSMNRSSQTLPLIISLVFRKVSPSARSTRSCAEKRLSIFVISSRNSKTTAINSSAWTRISITICKLGRTSQQPTATDRPRNDRNQSQRSPTWKLRARTVSRCLALVKESWPD